MMMLARERWNKTWPEGITTSQGMERAFGEKNVHQERILKCLSWDVTEKNREELKDDVMKILPLAESTEEEDEEALIQWKRIQFLF